MNVTAYIFSINSQDDARFYVKASDGQTTIHRIYALNSTLNQAELYAVQFAAMCHKKPSELTIITDSYYLEGILARESNGGWKKEIIWNKDLAEQTRNLIKRLNFKIKIDEQEIANIRSSIVY